MKSKKKSKAKKKQNAAYYRFGIGYDVHKFSKDRKLVLGGVEIPSELGLLGHSDADVLLHAICDALLGAAAMGDIGSHFPDTDEKFKDISSLRLLKKVSELLLKAGYKIGNIDATVILESPKIAKFTDSMCRTIAEALDIPSNAVSVKATTNEGLGALGRGEGCSALATAAVIMLDRD